jgi:hypothetical protein
MSPAHWSLPIGLLLLTMLLLDSFLPRLPFTVAMIYLGVGYVLSPGVLNVLAPDPVRYAGILELVTEITLLIALFAVGSVFYLVFALGHADLGAFGPQLTAFTLATVAASIIVHGATVHALMGWYNRHEAA